MTADGIPAPEALLAHAGFVRALVRDLVRDEHEAQDVEQEVYLAAMCQPHTLKGSPAAWITVVARRGAHKLHRERNRRTRRESVAARPEAVEPTADNAAGEGHDRSIRHQQGAEAMWWSGHSEETNHSPGYSSQCGSYTRKLEIPMTLAAGEECTVRLRVESK